MKGFLSQLISLILIFFMLIVSPLINDYGIQEMENRTKILENTSEFLDKVTDKGSISDDDLNEFYLEIEAHGLVLNVEVSRFVKTATMGPTGEVNTTYMAADDMTVLNTHDIVQVKLTELSVTPYQKLLRMFLRLNRNNYELQMAKMVK